LCDVLLESPTVGLLGLRIFELPAVGLPEFNKHLPGTARAELSEEGLRGEEENAGDTGGGYEGNHPNSDEAPGARNSDGR
jgi:hypothetical protein